MAITRSLARNMKANASNNLVSVLPPEIIEWEILTRLPVKSLLRFKSACKSWNVLISSNHDFVMSHLDLNPNKDSLLLEQSDDCKTHDNLILGDFMLVGCINGLVCLFGGQPNDVKLIEIAIWNPAINQCLVITHTKGAKGYDTLLGFGFDSVTNNFKIMLGTLIGKKPLAVDVYSCNAACWKKSTATSNILYSGGITKGTKPTIVNGSPFWLNSIRQDSKISLVVISFEVRNEVFRLLPSLIVNHNTESKFCALMNFQDSLAIMVYDTYFDVPMDVYIFNQRCSIWNKISIGPFICKEPNIKLNKIYIGKWMLPETIVKVHRLIPCFRNGDILFVDRYGCRLYSVNPETHRIKILKQGTFEEQIYCCLNYSESLIFIKGMKPVFGKSDEGQFRFLLRGALELTPQL